ncbi:MAG TPA: SUMF1/EgtB/PvdO family nonheme iron enzyme, partial [Anaerolineae bacterium]|nr:SUMF1/EgtB/PvdO family nonheme iron enzyme [Anaerolineae bacterium]
DLIDIARDALQSPPPQSLPFSLFITLGSLTGGAGGTLIAEQLELWRAQSPPPTTATIATWLRENITRNPPLRHGLDNLLHGLQAIPNIQAHLDASEKTWFNNTLLEELAQLGNLDLFADQLVRHNNNYLNSNHPQNPDALRQQYCHHLINTTRHLSITGVDPHAPRDAAANLNLESVYTTLFTHSVAITSNTLLRETISADGQFIPAINQLNHQRYLILLGPPGAGKSTFVNFLVLCLAGHATNHDQLNLARLTAPVLLDSDDDLPTPQTWDHGPLLPLRILLADFVNAALPAADEDVSGDILWRFIQRDLAQHNLTPYAPFLRRELVERGGLLLLDGLDEVPPTDILRTQLKEIVADFAVTFPRLRILITSRTFAYQKQNWRFPHFTELILAPFGTHQLRDFVARWYANIAPLNDLSPDEAQAQGELLHRSILASKRLTSLAERPLLLTLMASLHTWRGGSLPERREELYADTVDLLFDAWEGQRVVHKAPDQLVVTQPSLAQWLGVERGQIRDTLYTLAFHAHNAQTDLSGTADISETDLVDALIGLNQNPDIRYHDIVNFIKGRSGLLVARMSQVYTFPHRTFQLYLAACYLTDHDYPYHIARLTCTDPDRWREVALLAGAKASRGSSSAIWNLVEQLCPDPYDPIRHTAPHAWGAHVAGQALIEIANLGRQRPQDEKLVNRVRNWLSHVIRLDHLPAVERVRSSRNLVRLGPLRPELTDLLQTQFCFVPRGSFWMGDEAQLHQNNYLNYDYWISRFPVTQAQFRPFVDAGGYENSDYWAEAEITGVWRNGRVKGWEVVDQEPRQEPYDFGYPFNLPNHPVVGITWYEALAFCRWLTETWSLSGDIPPGWAIHLPSEAEWEKAARGGFDIPRQPIIRNLTTAPFGVPARFPLTPNPNPQRRFPWGNNADPERANYTDTDIGASNGVGCFPHGLSPYGCEELIGNIWEWTRSLPDPYPYNPHDGRENLTRRGSRGLRGGAFYSHAHEATALYRDGDYPFLRYRGNGFRLVVIPA